MARRNYYTGKYKLDKAEYLSAKYYAMRYESWKDEYNDCKDSVSAVVPDDMPHGTTVGNPTERLAIRREELLQKIELIEQTAIEADGDFYQWILRHATQGVSYEYLSASGELFCSRRSFFRKMNKFYWLLSSRI